MRILLVDDDPSALRLYGAILAKQGYDVVAADAGVDAMDRLAGDSAIDAVVTDFSMPGIKGDTLLSLIRARWPALPVVILTSNDGLEKRARDIGAFAYLQKPCPAPTLVRALARIPRK